MADNDPLYTPAGEIIRGALMGERKVMADNDPLYALLAVALLTHRDTLRAGPYAAQVAALDALIGLMTTAREQAVRKGKLQSALPVKQARRRQEQGALYHG